MFENIYCQKNSSEGGGNSPFPPRFQFTRLFSRREYELSCILFVHFLCVEVILLSRGEAIVRSSGGYANVAIALGMIPPENVFDWRRNKDKWNLTTDSNSTCS